MTTATEQLRGAGLRVTEPRLSVHAALALHPHSTAAALIEYIAGDASGADISKQGVYNVLDDLSAAGLVRRIEPAGSAARFELRVGDNHHHLVCRVCGRTEDVDCAVGEAPCLVPVSNSGFVLDEAEVVWWGRCADCAAAPQNSLLSASRSATPIEPIDSSNGTAALTQETRL